MNSGTAGLANGEKSVANFDEDSLTMAVSAGIDCVNGFERSDLQGVYFASTTLPYRERQNAGIISGALAMPDSVRTADFTGSLKAGTTALISGLEAVAAKGMDNLLVCCADSRLGKAGSPQEMIFGDGAAAFLLSEQDVIAEYKGSFSLAYDFVDHYRGSQSRFDKQWEERWIRDIGFDRFIPESVNGLLKKYHLKLGDFAKVIYPCYSPAARKELERKMGLNDPNKVQDPMLDKIGEMGAAQPLSMLVRALEEAKPGDKILVVSFGSGCDALYFEVTEKIQDLKKRKGISGSLANRVELESYEKYLAWRNILAVDTGLRAEEDFWTRWSLIWRARKAILGFTGSKCKKCGTPQFPPQRICVNPKCGAVDQMEEYCFSTKTGKVFSYTGDNLAPSIDPPTIYGHILFEGGGKYLMDFTDCNFESIYVGMPVYFSFRVKYIDEKRDLTGYFWKAVPKKEGE